jgi:hypothetical protein
VAEVHGRPIEVRGFKWPRRPTAVAAARLLGEDEHGRWLGVTQGSSWWTADRARGGVFVAPLVKLVPIGTYWTACFHPGDLAVDADVVLPVSWCGDVLEEVDLELDVQRDSTGVHVRDRDEFERVHAMWPMPPDVVSRAEDACQQLREQVAARVEPFGVVGLNWLVRFLASGAAEEAR